MLSRKLAPALASIVVVSGLLAFLSCDDTNAKQDKPVKMAAKAKRTSKCCAPGYIFCPTGADGGCDCCGVSVKGTLKDYQKKQANKVGTGHLTITGLSEDGKEDDVEFAVDNPTVDKALPGMVGKPGQFIIKLKPYEYKLADVNQPAPHDNPNLTHWHGTRYECEDLGDENGKMKDRTVEFISGWRASGKILEVRAKLEELVDSYPPERKTDERP